MRFITNNFTLSTDQLNHLNMMVNLYIHEDTNTGYNYVTSGEPVYMSESLIRNPIPSWLLFQKTQHPGVVEVFIDDTFTALSSDEYTRCRIIAQQGKVSRLAMDLDSITEDLKRETKNLADMINSREQVK